MSVTEAFIVFTIFYVCVLVASCICFTVRYICDTTSRVKQVRKVIKRAEELRDQGRCEEALKYLLDNKPKW